MKLAEKVIELHESNVTAQEIAQKLGDEHYRLANPHEGDQVVAVSFKHRDYKIQKDNGKIYVQSQGTMHHVKNIKELHKHIMDNAAWYMSTKRK